MQLSINEMGQRELEAGNTLLSEYAFISSTVRPHGTRPRGTRTSLVHDFKKGSKIFEISDFGT